MKITSRLIAHKNQNAHTNYRTTFTAFCCADIRDPSARSLLLSKINKVDVIFYCSALFVQTGLQMISDMSMSTCSSASIAENPLLCGRACSPGDLA